MNEKVNKKLTIRGNIFVVLSETELKQIKEAGMYVVQIDEIQIQIFCEETVKKSGVLTEIMESGLNE